MFSKAPKGAVMIDGFAPYMTTARLDGYQRELSEINAGVRQTDTSVAAYLNAAGADSRGFDAAHPGFASFDAQWPAIDSQMTGLMDQVQGNLGNYQAVAALPSFKLFPWFFVIPGRPDRRRRRPLLVRPVGWRRGRWVLVVLGVGLVAAPAVFQMFQRAQTVAAMMTAFENIETTQNVEQIQGFFGSMAVGQGAIRLDMVPALEQTGLTHGRRCTAFSGAGHARYGLGPHPQRHDPDDRGDERQRDQLPGCCQPARVPALPVVLRDPGRPGRRSRGGRRHPAQRRRRDRLQRRFDRTRAEAALPADNATTDDRLRRSPMTRRTVPFFLLALAAASLGVISTGAPVGASSGKHALVGTFKLSPGACTGETVTGSYFRMIFPGGSVASGKFFDNPDSACDDKSYTLAVPGTQGGLVTGSYQPNPTPPFNAGGGALVDSIVQPESFTAIDFSIATNKVDPQTGDHVPAPSLSVAGGKISGSSRPGRRRGTSSTSTRARPNQAVPSRASPRR